MFQPLNTRKFLLGSILKKVSEEEDEIYNRENILGARNVRIGRTPRKHFKGRSGFEVYGELKWLLEHLPGLKRSPFQVTLHNAFLVSLAKRIFQKEWTTQSVLIKTVLHLPAIIPMEVFACCPRRWGKTTALLYFMAAAIATVPGLITSLYSTTRDQTSAGRDVIYDVLQRISNFGGVFIKANTKKLTIRFSKDDIRQLTANPCSVKVSISHNNSNKCETLIFFFNFMLSQTWEYIYVYIYIKVFLLIFWKFPNSWWMEI